MVPPRAGGILRGAHLARVDAVLHDVQDGGHISPGARFQRRHDPLIAPQLRDFPHEQPVNVRGYFRAAGVNAPETSETLWAADRVDLSTGE